MHDHRKVEGRQSSPEASDDDWVVDLTNPVFDYRALRGVEIAKVESNVRRIDQNEYRVVTGCQSNRYSRASSSPVKNAARPWQTWICQGASQSWSEAKAEREQDTVTRAGLRKSNVPWHMRTGIPVAGE